MKNQLEPSYLRYVYNHLKDGSITSDNASGLPQGFIGLYEQEFASSTAIQKRQETLLQLTVFALLKDAVSASFVADVLNINKQGIDDLIQNHSNWFNSPKSGVYMLYHDRLRIYLLQKTGNSEVYKLNEQIIAYLQKSIESKKSNEAEYYALENLAKNMCFASELGFGYERLHEFVNQEQLWKRQIQISKGYSWSQNAVQQGIKEGARRNHEMNTIRSTVNSVKLMTQEQNSADDILNLLNEGDYPTALKRAENWEGERQFKLYLLFIHELTIGKSKEADFRKEACKAVLEAIDQTPEDHSVRDWCTFYPELAIYKYHEELLNMELDGMVIWKRGKYTLEDLIERKDVNIEIIKSLAHEIIDESAKSKSYLALCKVIMEEGKDKEAKKVINESISIASELINESTKYEAYLSISKVLIEQGEKEESLRLASEISQFCEKSKEGGVNVDNIQDDAYSYISKVLIEQGEKEESLRVASEIVEEGEKSEAYANISKTLMDQGKKEESIRIASKITDESIKSRAYANISKLLMEQGCISESQSAMQESLRIASEIRDENIKVKSYASISKFLMEQGEKKDAKKLIQESICITNDIKGDIMAEFIKGLAYPHISKVLIEIFGPSMGGKTTLAFEIATSVAIRSDEGDQSDLYAYISEVLNRQGDNEEAKQLIQESLRVASEITNERVRSIIYADISKILMEHGDKEESLRVASEITDEWEKSSAYANLSKILMEQGEKEESLKVASEITNERSKSKVYGEISKILIEQGKMKASQETMKTSLSVAAEITRAYEKSKAFDEYKTYGEISKILIEQGNMKASLKVASEITDEWKKSSAYGNLSKILIEQGKMRESLKVASEITDAYKKFEAYASISKVLIEHGDKEESLRVASEIKDERKKSEAYASISKTLMDQGEKDESLFVASEITNEDEAVTARDDAYSFISKVLIEQGEKEESLRVASKIKFNSPSFRTYLIISKVLHDQGHKIKADKLMSKLLSVTSGMQDREEKSRFYLSISKVLMSQGKKEEAKKVMQESLRVASEISRNQPKTESYLAIIKVLIEQGEEISEVIKEYYYFASKANIEEIYKYHLLIIKILIKNGEKEDAFRLALAISDVKYKYNAIASISNFLMDQGEKEEAIRVASEICDVSMKSNAEIKTAKTETDYSYVFISELLIEQGEKEEALELLKMVKTGSERLKVFTDFGEKLAFREAQNMVPSIPSEENKNALIKGMSQKINEEMKSSESINPYLYNHSERTQYFSNILFHQAKMACFFEKERNEEKLDILSEAIDIKDWRRISV